MAETNYKKVPKLQEMRFMPLRSILYFPGGGGVTSL